MKVLQSNNTKDRQENKVQFLFKVRPNNEVEAPVVRISNNDRDIQVHLQNQQICDQIYGKGSNNAMGPMWALYFEFDIDPKLYSSCKKI